MKVKIVDYFWAVGCRTRRKGSVRLPLKEGESKALGGLRFRIDKVEGDKVSLSLLREDGSRIKELSVSQDKGNYYRPLSMDGGHEYVLKLTRW